MATAPQRAYRALCPHCGAPVDFASAASASAVCSFCRSTLVRDGDALRRIGVSAELFDDHSPLQLGASGTRQGMAFTLVGRLQYGHAGGTWNEWHALFDNGRSAWLSEDNGAYVIAFDAPLPADAPAVISLQAGQRVLADGRAWDVASVVQAHLIAAAGELPQAPRLQGDFTVVDLRNSTGEVATLDGMRPGQPGWSVGRAVALSELALQGLQDAAAEKTLTARGTSCPNCGAALDIQLASTQSISCRQCNAVVDVSQGVGADLLHYQQANSSASGLQPQLPQLPLGRSGTLALGGPALPWQVVGYQERCSVPQPGPGDEDDDETSDWREYLLYNRTAGFAFLVDSEQGWSWVRPITGAPAQARGQAVWQGTTYRQTETYAAKVTWVQGEFYWRVQRDETAQVSDYEGTGAAAAQRLSREQTPNEVTWSAGQTLDAAVVAEAFAIAPDARVALQRGTSQVALQRGTSQVALQRGTSQVALQRDVAPVSFGGGGLRKILIGVVIVIVLVALLSQCGRDDCADVRRSFGASSLEYQQCARNRGTGGGVRTGGGSFGGWSSGSGGHK